MVNRQFFAAYMFVLCIPLGVKAQFQTYELPSSPSVPTKLSDCAEYAKKVRALVRSIESAHDRCLSSATSSSARKLGITLYSLRSSDSLGACTEPQCQSLHDQRDSYQAKGGKRVEACNAAVAEYKARESEKSVKQQQREQLESTARDIAITGAAGATIRGAATGALRGGGAVLANPVLGTAEPFLEPENGKNIYDATAALRRQGKGGSGNAVQDKLLKQQEREEKAEAERTRRPKGGSRE